MNYTMGRYIDEATDEMRDRLVTAPGFSAGDWEDLKGCRCLVGTAVGGGYRVVCKVDPAEVLRIRVDGRWRRLPASMRYPRAVRRFGLNRIVPAIKARASRSNNRAVAEMLSETVERV